MAKITAITETRKVVDGQEYEGYAVTAGDETYFVGISTGQNCCEQSGYMMVPESPTGFIGHELRCVTLDGKPLYSTGNVSEESAEFVNVETSVGTFQLVVYNEHNGYYGHDVIVLLTKEGQPPLCMKSGWL
jgi:hypothetical protein